MSAHRFNRAHAAIIDCLLQFSMRDGLSLGSSWVFHHPKSTDELVPGDLVRLHSMGDPEFRISWLKDVRHTHGGPEYLVASARGRGKEAWWGNVGITYFDREAVSSQPTWRWTDEQHKFNDRWLAACWKDRDADWHRPMHPVFDGNRATLRTRVKFNISTYQPEVHVDDFRAATRKDLGLKHDELVAMHHAHDKASRVTPAP